MKSRWSSESAPKHFVSESQFHWPRKERSFINIFLGTLMLYPGWYLVANDLPETSSNIGQIRFAATPLIVGAVCIVFGIIGLVTAFVGSARRGDDAIDLKLSAKGITVRGGRRIPWDSISHVTCVEFHNDAKMQLMWDRADLNRGLIVGLTDTVDVPGLSVKDGEPQLRVNLIRYPAVDYRPLFEKTIVEFERRHIPIDEKRTSRQF